jgi:hypothetical protein
MNTTQVREKPTGVIITDRLLSEADIAVLRKAVRAYDGASLPLAEYLEKRLGIGIEHITFEGQTMSEQKHDGDLGSGYTVAMHYSDVNITDDRAEFVSLTPEQALKLLAWLEEEYINLLNMVRAKR